MAKTRTRPATLMHDPAPWWRTQPLACWYDIETFIFIYIIHAKNYVRLHDILYVDIIDCIHNNFQLNIGAGTF